MTPRRVFAQTAIWAGLSTLVHAALPAVKPRIVIVGDSYASGIGAGRYLNGAGSSDWFCNRFDQAYGYRFSNDPTVEGGDRSFRACAGDMMEHIPDQLASARADLSTGIADYLLISISGNDVGFADVINDCVYQFKQSWTLGHAGGDCDETLEASMQRIQDPQFKDHFKNALRQANVLVHRDGAIFVNGYAQFWGRPEPNDPCHRQTWSRYRSDGPKLTSARRIKMNDGVVLVNKIIQDSIGEINTEIHNPNRFQYIDVDAGFSGKRFCESVNGDDPKGSNDPNKVWFIEYDTDIDPTALATAPTNPALYGEAWARILGGADNSSTTIDMAHNRSSNLHPPAGPSVPHRIRGRRSGRNDRRGASVAYLEYTKVFHPKPEGHGDIVSRIKDYAGRKRGAVMDNPQEAFNRPTGDLSVNGQPYNIEALFKLLSDGLCNLEACQIPDGFPAGTAQMGGEPVDENNPFVAGMESCEIAVALPDNTEAYVRRGPLSYNCVNVLSDLANALGTLPDQNQFHWTGQIQYESYSAGFRTINFPDHIHPDLDPGNTLQLA